MRLIDFLCPFEFSKLCLTVIAKIVTYSDIVLNICTGKTFKIIIL